MYGGSNKIFAKNENFPLVLDIKLHLKMPVNYQLQISPPPYLNEAFTVGPTVTKMEILRKYIQFWDRRLP